MENHAVAEEMASHDELLNQREVAVAAFILVLT
jgi:hypothetical protein